MIKAHHITARIAAFVALAASVAPQALAVPATPRPVTMTRPDGSTLTVRLHGDEHGHYTTSTDGYLLVNAPDGYLHYAVMGTDGRPTASTLRATEVSARTAAEKSLLASIDRNAVIAAEMALQAPAREASRAKQAAMALPAPSAAPSRAAADDIAAHRAACGPTTVCTGSPRLLAVLVQYADTKFTTANPTTTFQSMCNKVGFADYSATGSARDYFVASSNGAYTPTFDVVGPVTVSQKSSYYAGSTGHEKSAELVMEVARLINSSVDFTKYDANGDGTVDNITIFFAGYGMADTGKAGTIWPHSSRIASTETFDGKRLGNFIFNQELGGSTGVLAGIGTLCHEFSHALGLPDLYNTDRSSDDGTPGYWTVMDVGSYTNGMHTPPLHSAYERWTLGWIAPKEYTANLGVTTKLRPAETDGYDDVQLIRTEKKDEFYLLENRQRKGWDAYLPGHGMLAWHIDFVTRDWSWNCPNNTGNDASSRNSSTGHKNVLLVAANGKQTNLNTGATPFPGTSKVTTFSPLSWAEKATGVKITSIAEDAAGSISFAVNGGKIVEATQSILNTPVIKDECATLSWKAVEGVTEYFLTISDSKGNPVVDNITVEGTEYTATLAESTSYTYKVTWATPEGSYYSKGEFTTSIIPITRYAVSAAAVADVADHTASASWEACPRATGYTVEVKTYTGQEGYTLNEDFTDKVYHSEGWSDNKTWSTTAYGTAAPGISFSATTNFIETPFNADRTVDTLKFYAASSSSLSSAQIAVKAIAADGTATTVYTMKPTSVTASTKPDHVVTLGRDILGDEAHAVRIALEKTGTNKVIIDDITVIYDETYQYTDAGIADASTTATTHAIKGLTAGTPYAFRVTATDGTLWSKPSKWIHFTTTGSDVTAIDTIGADQGDNAAWYTVTGLRLNERPTLPGLYIHRRKLVRIP